MLVNVKWIKYVNVLISVKWKYVKTDVKTLIIVYGLNKFKVKKKKKNYHRMIFFKLFVHVTVRKLGINQSLSFWLILFSDLFLFLFYFFMPFTAILRETSGGTSY